MLVGGSAVHHQVGLTVRLMGGALSITVARTVSVMGTHLSRKSGVQWEPVAVGRHRTSSYKGPGVGP